MSETQSLSLADIEDLAYTALSGAGADEDNARAVAENVARAEQDGALSHGLFRIPGYVAGLKSGKVNGNANPETITQGAIVRCDAQNGYAPLALKRACPVLAETAKQYGTAVLTLTRAHHFAALWHETESLANLGVAALACTCYMPAVAPAGGNSPLFGTNPISFAWPRTNNSPVVFDMATASMAKGEIQLAAQENRSLPQGCGLDKDGNHSTDPNEILKGVILPFGGYKGSAISLMVELLSAALIGENFSFEAAQNDNKDGAPPRGGEFILALAPQVLAGDDWNKHAESLFNKMKDMPGVRLPGERRHQNRKDEGERQVNVALINKIKALNDN